MGEAFQGCHMQHVCMNSSITWDDPISLPTDVLFCIFAHLRMSREDASSVVCRAGLVLQEETQPVCFV